MPIIAHRSGFTGAPCVERVRLERVLAVVASFVGQNAVFRAKWEKPEHLTAGTPSPRQREPPATAIGMIRSRGWASRASELSPAEIFSEKIGSFRPKKTSEAQGFSSIFK
jgi:hypothetical protein